MKINEDDQKILDAVCKLVSEKELDVFLKGLKVNNIELNKLPTVHELGDIVLSDIYWRIKLKD